MLIRDLHRAEQKLIAIAITDPEFGAMRIRVDFQYQEVDVGQVPPDVIVYCKQLEKKGKPQP